MTITISSGVTGGDLTISAGDPLVVLSGGKVRSSTILSGGSATLSSGAVGSALTVSSGGVLEGPGDLGQTTNVYGSVIGVTVSGANISGASEIVLEFGGVASGVMAVAGGELFVAGGASASGAVLSAGSLVDYGSGAGAQVESGGMEYVYSGGVTSGDTIEVGGLASIKSSGAAYGDVVESGGQLHVSKGAEVTSATVESGGQLYVSGGANVASTMVESGGGVDLMDRDITSDLTLTTSDVVTSTTILGGITFSSGVQVGLTENSVVSGVTLSLAAGAAAENLRILSGGVVVGPGDLYDSDNVVSGGGAVSGATLSGAGSDLHVLSGATLDDVTALADAAISVSAGGSALGTALSDSLIYVYSGGVTTGDIVESGGGQFILSGGIAISTTVFGGSVESGSWAASRTRQR